MKTVRYFIEYHAADGSLQTTAWGVDTLAEAKASLRDYEDYCAAKGWDKPWIVRVAGSSRKLPRR